MSLVYEALQKAEREKERKNGTEPVQRAPTLGTPATAPHRVVVARPAPPPATQPARNYLPAMIVCVSVVALAAIVYIVALAAKSLTEKHTTAAVDGGTHSVASEPKPADLTAPAIPAAPVTSPVNSTANDPRFTLTGIMKMGENYGAVINGRIVYENQYVDGAIVKKVERDRVTLNVDDREIVVRLF